MQILNGLTQEDSAIFMGAYRSKKGSGITNHALDMLCDEKSQRNGDMHRDYEVMRMSMPDQSSPWHKRINPLPYG